MSIVKIDGETGIKTCPTPQGVEFGMVVTDYASQRERAVKTVMESFHYWSRATGFPEGAEPEIVEVPHVIPGRTSIGWYYLLED